MNPQDITALATILTAIATVFTAISYFWIYRPKIEFDVVCKNGFYCLAISNTGSRTAKINKLTINDDFIETLQPDELNIRIRKALYHLQKRRARLAAGTTKYYVLLPSHPEHKFTKQWFEAHAESPRLLEVKVRYNSLYRSNDEFDLLLNVTSGVDFSSDLQKLTSEIRSLNQTIKAIKIKTNK